MTDRPKFSSDAVNHGLPAAVIVWARTCIDDIGRMSGEHPEDIPTDDLAHMWARLDDLRDTLAVWVRDLAVELGDRIEAHDGPYSTAATGLLYAERARTVKWDGHAVLTELAEQVVDPDTGVTMTAVPVEVLEQVLPACKPGQTSSRWNAKALAEHVALKLVRDVTEGPPLPKRWKKG